MDNAFADFKITPNRTTYKGDKIKLGKLVGKDITVHDYKIEKSKFEEANDDCLHIQIELAGEKRVVFTSAVYLLDVIQQVPKEKFPFTTTIKKDNEYYEFT